MNQILSVENNTKKRKKLNDEATEIAKIIRFFAIALIIFGVFNIGIGSYAMYKDKKGVSNGSKKPIIEIEQKTEKEILLKVTSESSINEICYNWNGDAEKKITGNGRKSIEETIVIPAGENSLYVRATDVSGQTEIYQNEFTRNSKISIQVESADPNIKLKIEGQDEISYITYRWNNEEETQIDINSKIAEQEISVKEGINTLTITAVDINNETETLKKQIQGIDNTNKPKVEVTTDGSSNFIIKGSDEKGLKRVEFIINETEKFFLNLDGRKELEYAYPLHDGENKIEVTLYNLDDKTDTFRAKLTK